VRETLTTCTFCGCGCNFYLRSEGGHLVGVSPVSGHPVSETGLCIKGWHAHEFVESPDRLTTPLLRRGGELTPVSWDEALKVVTERLVQTRRSHGADALAFFSSAKCTNEENYLMMKLARAVFGTNNVDHCARLCHASSVVGLAATFGSGAMTNSIAELEDSDCILITGSNTTDQHPQVAARILRAVEKDASLIIVDPRRDSSGTAAVTSWSSCSRPRTLCASRVVTNRSASSCSRHGPRRSRSWPHGTGAPTSSSDTVWTGTPSMTTRIRSAGDSARSSWISSARDRWDATAVSPSSSASTGRKSADGWRKSTLHRPVPPGLCPTVHGLRSPLEQVRYEGKG